MVGKLGRIAALFGSKTSLGTTSAHPSTITLCDDAETRSEANFKRSWSFRLSKKKKKGIYFFYFLILLFSIFNLDSQI
ncbi:hypothetical protein O3M35_007327 [Rhynocoris fuscipes]|uniref:Uncharacterized protein n=1 Tax=Rhynocoris fuscipes TaxID=488301 RepID=A0AAW1DCN0_9HEMI